MNRLWIGGAIALVLILIVGGIGWKAKWLEIKLNNARVGERSATQEKELGGFLNEGLEDYIEHSHQRRDTVDQSIGRIHEAAAERPDGSDGLLARMRRSDAAWRSGVVELCPECAPGGVGNPSDGIAEELSGGEAASSQ